MDRTDHDAPNAMTQELTGRPTWPAAGARKEPMSTNALAPDRSHAGKKVLVVGASGFLGRSVVRGFASAGYEVRGLVRDTAKGARVLEDGGTSVLGDVLDVRSLEVAATDCFGVIHLAANPPVESDTARVRVEGARNIVEAARRRGVRRVVVGSGYWVYRGQPELIDENSPVDPRGESQINYDAEREGMAANSPGELEVLVVRPGMVYGNGSWFRGIAEAILSGKYRLVGEGTNRWSFVDRWDAGAAFRTVLELGSAGEIYNVVDGHPATLRDFADFVATQLGVSPPAAITLEAASGEMGNAVAHHLAADRPTSSGKLSRLGWRARVSSFREGVPDLLREMFPRNARTQ